MSRGLNEVSEFDRCLVVEGLGEGNSKFFFGDRSKLVRIGIRRR